MEGKEGLDSSEVIVKGDEAAESYQVAPSSVNPSEMSGSTMELAPAMPSAEVKKKRGRPRKYAPDGSLIVPLSPMPISASIPLTGEFTDWTHTAVKPVDSFKKKYNKTEFESPGERMAYSVGANFTPHILTVNTGEDVAMKIISFSQQGSRAICILAANGSISNVTLRQPNSCGGTLTYEGHFEMLSLTGSFMPTDDGATKSRSGGMSVSLAGPDGRVMGGGIAGLLVAASPVQVVVGSFLPGHQQVQKPKKQKYDSVPAFSITHAKPISREGNELGYGVTKPNLTSPTSFHTDNPSLHFTHTPKTTPTENFLSLPAKEPLHVVANPEATC